MQGNERKEWLDMEMEPQLQSIVSECTYGQLTECSKHNVCLHFYLSACRFSRVLAQGVS